MNPEDYFKKSLAREFRLRGRIKAVIPNIDFQAGYNYTNTVFSLSVSFLCHAPTPILIFLCKIYRNEG